MFDGGSHSPHPHILTGTPVVASMEMSPNTRYRHLKRPLDVTSLEKGPPLVKKLSQPTRFGPLGSAKPMDLLQDKPVPQSHHLQIGQRLHQADGIQFNKTAHHAHPGGFSSELQHHIQIRVCVLCGRCGLCGFDNVCLVCGIYLACAVCVVYVMCAGTCILLS